MHRIVTVGREFGSGGREFGKRLAERLGIAYYDNEIVTAISKKTELAESYVNQVLNNGPSVFFPITVGRTFYPQVDPAMDINNAIYLEQSNIIREIAEKSDCVIVGRCADFILREQKPFRVFVYAEMESKLARCRAKAPEDEHLSDRELGKRIHKIDKQRANYYQFYTGQNWGDWLNYDLCINTSNAPIKGIVEAVAHMLEEWEN